MLHYLRQLAIVAGSQSFYFCQTMQGSAIFAAFTDHSKASIGSEVCRFIDPNLFEGDCVKGDRVDNVLLSRSATVLRSRL